MLSPSLDASIRDQFAAAWQLRRSMFESGLAPTPNADPTGSLGEALAIGALWGRTELNAQDPLLQQARKLRTTQQTIDGKPFAAALGSISMTGGSNPQRNVQAVDFVAPWESIWGTVKAKSLKGFGTARTSARAVWDEPYCGGNPNLARVQVKTRAVPRSIVEPDYTQGDSKSAKGPSSRPNFYHAETDQYAIKLPREKIFGTTSRGSEAPIPDNDLFMLILFSDHDEEGIDLSGKNFVWTAILATPEGMAGLSRDKTVDLTVKWGKIHELWHGKTPNLPDGVWDCTELLRALGIAGW